MNLLTILGTEPSHVVPRVPRRTRSSLELGLHIYIALEGRSIVVERPSLSATSGLDKCGFPDYQIRLAFD